MWSWSSRGAIPKKDQLRREIQEWGTNSCANAEHRKKTLYAKIWAPPHTLVYQNFYKNSRKFGKNLEMRKSLPVSESRACDLGKFINPGNCKKLVKSKKIGEFSPM